ncbi:hypothetical protein O181_047239 [Austropuccinia psidii MF-1]|uniref:Uncharacterized protein n=1 Tax=Austropuccinia psidii MF-1 TaxID=1389203 RepID=A0A9Q3DQM5_9BASI|nr:hypothetical protein [Austropuccinia psidii MF-1]
MSLVHLRVLKVPRSQPEDSTRPFISKGSGFGKHGYWKETQGENYQNPIHLAIQHTPQTSGLERYGSSTSAPPNAQKPVPMKHGKPEVQPGLKLGRN